LYWDYAAAVNGASDGPPPPLGLRAAMRAEARRLFPYSLIIPGMLSTKKSLMPSVTRTPSSERAFTLSSAILHSNSSPGPAARILGRIVGLIRPGLLLVEAALKARGDGQLR